MPVIRVDKGDLFTLAGGFAVILIIAVVANSGLLPSLHPGTPVTPEGPGVQVTATPTAVPTTVLTTPTPTPTANLTPQPPAAPTRILFTNNPFTYPMIHLPDRMTTFGTSNIPLRSNDTVTFAYVTDSRGGLTTIFTVPYEVWALNISVNATTRPQYSDFKMVLCDAKTGTILTGSEIQNGGSMYKVVRNTGPVYMIISVSYVDSYTILMETPYEYYVKAAAPGTT